MTTPSTPSSLVSRRSFISSAGVAMVSQSAIWRHLPRLRSTIPQVIEIHREASSDTCTTGYIGVDGRLVAYTLELPDVNNIRDLSRIPVGDYGAHVRYDHPDGWRVELDNVPGRSGVEIHVGNWPKETHGCILVGTQVSIDSCTVKHSSDAYDKLRIALYGSAAPSSIAPLMDLTVRISD